MGTVFIASSISDTFTSDSPMCRIFPCFLHVFQSTEAFRHRHLWINPVQLVKINPFDLQAPQAHLDLLAQILGAAHRQPLVRPLPRQPAFGGRSPTPASYGASASPIRDSHTAGPYESAVSMKFTPSSTARRSTALALSGSLGGPQTPLPVRPHGPRSRGG